MALPDWIYGHASPLSLGGRSLFNRAKRIDPSNVFSFSSAPLIVKTATRRLEEAGFTILQATPLTINFAAPPDAIERVTGHKLVEQEAASPLGDSVTFIRSADSDMFGHVSTMGTPLADVIEGLALEVPRELFQATPPQVNWACVGVPDGVAEGTNASALHRLGITGYGVKVAMVDSGWFRHPFFTAQGYNVAPVVLAPGASEPLHDESGHGTGESANILAVAPNCQLLPVKANFVNTIAAFNAAVELNPDIITCSWGSHAPAMLTAADMVLEASVAAAVARGIIVIFSAGNGHAGFPGQHPDVISAGGTLMHPDGTLEASNYSSGFASAIYPGRTIPDVCGLVGARPRAIYIMLPVEPGDAIDVDNAGGVFPDGDETAADDGWAGFSGTSAAAPQLAGAVALMKQIAPTIAPATAKDILACTARDVAFGTCSPVPGIHNGLPAQEGIDGATGPGLVDVFNAVVETYMRSIAGTLNNVTPLDELALCIAAYHRGVADAAANAATLTDPATAAYLRGLSASADATSQMYSTAALT